MLDYLQSLWCALSASENNRGTIITFNKAIQVEVPFASYGVTEWFAQVEIMRADPTICCSCCTPIGEAFNLATSVLSAAPDLPGARSTVVVLISEGDPWQNVKKTDGTIWPYPAFTPADYRYVIVPNQAKALKNVNPNVRIMFVGVPNASGRPPAL